LPDFPKLTLVLGGARSGKSRFAEEFVARRPAPWTYIATSEARDEEMAARIANHVTRRGAGWTTLEAPLDLAQLISEQGQKDHPVLVDCLTLWLSNAMLAGRPIDREIENLLAALNAATCPIVLVSNEVGLGIVPENKLAREFRDAQGNLNKQVAAAADHVVFIAAGLPLILKQT
jgi:adenosylcobinamide kinase / adenosylcobinamide-phosphate guanylyltransferase